MYTYIHTRSLPSLGVPDLCRQKTYPHVETRKLFFFLISLLFLQEEDYRDSITIATDMEEHYGHLFDSVIPFNDVDYVYEQLLYEINLLEREPQWVPAKWIRAELAGKVPLSATASLA